MEDNGEYPFLMGWKGQRCYDAGTCVVGIMESEARAKEGEKLGYGIIISHYLSETSNGSNPIHVDDNMDDGYSSPKEAIDAARESFYIKQDEKIGKIRSSIAQLEKDILGIEKEKGMVSEALDNVTRELNSGERE